MVLRKHQNEPLLWDVEPPLLEPGGDDVPIAPVLPVLSELAIAEMEAAEAQKDEHPGVFDDEPIESTIGRPEFSDGWLGGDVGCEALDEQATLFENPPSWIEHWKGMPAFAQRDLAPRQSIYVHFKNDDDRQAFATLVGQTVTSQTRSIWFPKAEIARMVDKRFNSATRIAPRYPVYVISKGRWKSRLTSRALEAMGVPYRIVVESQERDRYASVIDPAKILVLPFSNLGQGSIPARNWVWEHAVAAGAARHWILDDNIDGFFRLYQNLKVPVATGAIFRAMEAFTDRYENVFLSGPNYFMFASRKTVLPPITFNTRIYSCILVRNDAPFRWRGRYNEDTDLAIRVLKAGCCTILFNAFLAMKATTMTMIGGNTDELYQGDGRRRMAESLYEQHPDCVQITEKWGRPQHHVNYGRFRSSKLVIRQDARVGDGDDEFGMFLERVE